jgi:hypothetical protein
MSDLETLEPKAAAGLLARTALSLFYKRRADDEYLIADEANIRERVIRHAREQLGIAEDNYEQEALEKIADHLDQQADRLLSEPDPMIALKRLAERGDLPSDLYEIEIIPNVRTMLGRRFDLEKQLIETTVRAPTQEQHYGPAREVHEPAMISLFVRRFRTRWPLRDFIMLVAGERNGFKLGVHQAWRIYPAIINVAAADSPVELLKKFADKYGAEIELDGKRGHFFFLADSVPAVSYFQIVPTKKPQIALISFFRQIDRSAKVTRSSLVVSINQDRYLDTLEELGVKRDDILDKFVDAPRAGH